MKKPTGNKTIIRFMLYFWVYLIVCIIVVTLYKLLLNIYATKAIHEFLGNSAVVQLILSCIGLVTLMIILFLIPIIAEKVYIKISKKKFNILRYLIFQLYIIFFIGLTFITLAINGLGDSYDNYSFYDDYYTMIMVIFHSLILAFSVFIIFIDIIRRKLIK